MRFVFEKLLPNEDGTRETFICRSWEELIDAFPEAYEQIVDSKSIREGIKFEVSKYEESLQDYLSEFFYQSNVQGFKEKPMFHFNLYMLGNSPNKQPIPQDKIWLMIDYKA